MQLMMLNIRINILANQKQRIDNMGDVGDDYRAFKEAKKELNQKRLVETMAEIELLGLKYTSKNHGSHLIIGDYNFWPSSGKFQNRKTSKMGQGFYNLLKKLNS